MKTNDSKTLNLRKQVEKKDDDLCEILTGMIGRFLVCLHDFVPDIHVFQTGTNITIIEEPPSIGISQVIEGLVNPKGLGSGNSVYTHDVHFNKH